MVLLLDVSVSSVEKARGTERTPFGDPDAVHGRFCCLLLLSKTDSLQKRA